MHKKLILVLIGLIFFFGSGTVGARESKTDAQPVKVQKPTLPKVIEKKGTADEYVLVMSKNDNVCQYMMKAFNEDLRQYGDIKFDQHEEFTAIKWEKKRRYRINEKGEKDYDDPTIRESFLTAVFDLNNDGVKEFVLKSYERGLKGIPSDDLIVLKKEDEAMFKDGVQDSFKYYSKAMYHFDKNTYDLKEIPPAQITPRLGTKKNVPIYHFLGGWFYFNPFFYKGIYYVTMTDWQPNQAEKWLVVLKLNPANQLQDTCYYQKNLTNNHKTQRGK